MHDLQIIDIISSIQTRLNEIHGDLEQELDRSVWTDFRRAESWELMAGLARIITGVHGRSPADERRIQAWINRAHAIGNSGATQRERWVLNEQLSQPDGNLPPPDEHQAKAIRYLSLGHIGSYSSDEDFEETSAHETAVAVQKQIIPTRFGQELSQCVSVSEAVALARRRLPRLKAIQACQFLASISYPIAPPLPDLVRFCQHVGLMLTPAGDGLPENGNGAAAVPGGGRNVSGTILQAELLTNALDQAARVACMPLAHVVHLLALYCGARPLPDGGKVICSRNQPACFECNLTARCERYAGELEKQAGQSNKASSGRSSIKDWSADERPRERMLAGERLSSSELLALILRTGTSNMSAVELARNVINKFGSLHELQKATPGEIMDRMRGHGIGPAKAVEICAAIELGRRATQPAADTRTGQRAFLSSRDAFEHYRSRFKSAVQEEFIIVLLDTRLRILKDVTISMGTINASMAHPRDVFRVALREAAYAVMFIHNHPSGDPSPSQQDILLTARLVEAARLLGIEVTDHVIIGSHEWYSFSDHGRLK